MQPQEERGYIQQARGDPRAFVHLYDHYFPRIHAYVRYRVHGQQDAEDIIAEVFLKAMRRLGSFRWRHENSFAAWIFRIAHNRIVDYYRRRERVEIVETALNPGTSTSDNGSKSAAALRSCALRPEEALTQQETFQQMRALIETLSPRRREVITLRFFGGLRNKEIADILDLDERTIASHLSRGLRDLRDRYAAQTPLQVLEEANV
jgi:RNA polymerase sigma-70 factor (ECF subfamily)